MNIISSIGSDLKSLFNNFSALRKGDEELRIRTGAAASRLFGGALAVGGLIAIGVAALPLTASVGSVIAIACGISACIIGRDIFVTGNNLERLYDEYEDESTDQERLTTLARSTILPFAPFPRLIMRVFS